MNRNFALLALALAVIVGCADKADKIKTEAEKKKKPEGTVQIDRDANQKRELIQAVNFDDVANKLGIYTPDVCVRWVRTQQDTKVSEALEFTNSSGCSLPDYIAQEESEIAFRLIVKEDTPGEIYTFHNSLYETSMGEMIHDGTELVVERLCTDDLEWFSHEPGNGTCRINVQNGLWNSENPFIFAEYLD